MDYFGPQRLSIIDLSTSASQPMSLDGVVVAFNGEIYNFIELRKELEANGYEFRTKSDTEVLLKAFICWEMIVPSVRWDVQRRY